MKRLSLILLLGFIAALPVFAQEKYGDAEFDRLTHNFGDILIEDGPVSCSFNVRNAGSKPIAIYSVVSSCGCTDVKWTREPIMPGKTGKISATYSNDEGPYPFDKTLSVYVSGVEKPVVLRFRGISHEKKKTLGEMFPVRLGPLGIKESEIKGGNFEQGRQISDEFELANLSKSTVKLSFKDVTPELKLSVTSVTIPAGKTVKVAYTINSSREKWGKNWYSATPVIDGKTYKAISVWAITKENFSGWTKEQKDNGSRPIFESSAFTFDKVKAGKRINASFSLTNKGKSDFIVYKADCDNSGLSNGPLAKVAPGGKAVYNFSLDTTGMASGEVLVIISLITNSPSRPIVNLFITGWIE